MKLRIEDALKLSAAVERAVTWGGTALVNIISAVAAM